MMICTRCIMDTTDPDIRFDENGVCNHCKRYDAVSVTRLVAAEERERKLNAMVEEIKAVGEGKPYDCVIGVSGGVDSTYVAWLVKNLVYVLWRFISIMAGIPSLPSPISKRR